MKSILSYSCQWRYLLKIFFFHLVTLKKWIVILVHCLVYHVIYTSIGLTTHRDHWEIREGLWSLWASPNIQRVTTSNHETSKHKIPNETKRIKNENFRTRSDCNFVNSILKLLTLVWYFCLSFGSCSLTSNSICSNCKWRNDQSQIIMQ